MIQIHLPRPFALLVVIAGASLSSILQAEPQGGNGNPTASAVLVWPRPPELRGTARPWTRWWWPGSAVDKPNLTRQLEQLATAGLGGVEITPIYGARGYEERYLDYLSPQWMEMLDHAGREARRLGMEVDMATGTGWPFGGPWVGTADAAKKLVLESGELSLVPTGQKVKRAAPGGEGWVLDPYSGVAIGHYLSRFDEAFEGFPENLVRSQFHDSFEYYGADGTESLATRFEEMHGYRLSDWADVLMGARETDPDTLARLKADYRTALDTLHQDYLSAWNRWAHSHGWLTRNQSHGAPANLLDLYAIADIPETEIFGSTPFPIPGLRREADAIRKGLDLPEPLVSRMASSAAHVMGKPLVSCETATWLRDHWKVTLAYVKPELDRVLLDGINHVFYHGTVFSPRDAPWPGWLFYASTQFNPNNPWWDDFSSLNAYVTRVQSVLQDGSPDNPVLLYWPAHDIWHDPEGLVRQLTVHEVGFINETATGATARELGEAGYAFDYISDRQLMACEVQDGQIQTPGSTYRCLVVPSTAHMPLDTLETLERLANAGASVVFTALPGDVPGLGELESRRQRFTAILESLSFHDSGPNGLKLAGTGQGRIFVGGVAEALGQVEGLRPESLKRHGLDYIRRRSGDGWNYFIANLGSEPVEDWIPLGPPVQGASLFDPLSATTAGKAALRHRPDGTAEVYLQLDPGESVLLCTSREEPARGPDWPYRVLSGTPVTLNGDWTVSFISGGPVLPEERTARQLTSWTDWGDPELERFAGTARYSIEFEAPRNGAGAWLLDLGDVRESARVYLNGNRIGTAWSIPFRLRLGDNLKPGKNRLEIEVTNTAANRIRDLDRRGVDWKIMREINFVDINYKPFDASGWDLEPSGLLGPVRLVPVGRLDPLE